MPEPERRGLKDGKWRPLEEVLKAGDAPLDRDHTKASQRSSEATEVEGSKEDQWKSYIPPKKEKDHLPAVQGFKEGEQVLVVDSRGYSHVCEVVTAQRNGGWSYKLRKTNVAGGLYQNGDLIPEDKLQFA